MTAFEAIFEPVGIRADEPRPDEDRVDAAKLWVANPRRQKFRIEHLRCRRSGRTHGPHGGRAVVRQEIAMTLSPRKA